MSSYITSQLDRSEFGDRGYYDEESQYQYIYEKERRFVSSNQKILVIGAAGADGIEFVMRPHDPKIYAYYPISDDIVELASGFEKFIEGWRNGSISV